jgi:formylglycine-generating enzyme required for sulfatase activity
VKLTNVLPVDAAPSASPRDDIRALGLILGALINEIAPVRRSVGELVQRMVDVEGHRAFAKLSDLIEAAGKLDQELFPPPAPTPAIEQLAARKKTKPVLIVAGVVGLLVVVTGAVLWQFKRVGREELPASAPRPADLGTMVKIPAGEFIYQQGETRKSNAFYIDRYEVTIGEYKLFLDAIAGETKPPEHAFAGRHRDHQPENWDKILRAIQDKIPLNDQRLSWDSPIFGVTWFDAYSYAAWRGKRLPTEEEWEKAGRGTNGFIHPWGNRTFPGPVPTTTDVYADPIDKSSFGVIGLAGGVSEWTATTPDRETAVVRGGSWGELDVPLTRRITDRSRELHSATIGFRCAADKDVKP